MVILTLICPNGLGHYRRCIEVMARLQAARPEINFVVCCESWQIERMQDWPLAQQFWSGSARAIHGVMQPGVAWEDSPNVYRDQRLFEWETRLQGVAELETASLVLSDNLPGILSYRPDAVLMGSFLWGELLESKHPNSADTKRYGEYELNLLTEHKPPMICVQALAMPSVLKLCEPIGVGFMCPASIESQGEQSIKRERVALLVGATSALSPKLSELLETLIQAVGGPIWTSSGIIAEQKMDIRQDLRAFEFTPEAYAACKLVICRPGVGTITECLAQATPMLTVHEDGNGEMEHNANVLESRGVAINIGPEITCNRVQNAVVRAAEQSVEMRSAVHALDRNGFHQAVSYILDRIARL